MTQTTSSNPNEHAFTEVSWDPQVSGFLAAALGAEQFRRIQAAIAVPPLSTCVRVNTLRTSTQDVMQQLQGLLPQQHSAVHFAPHPQLPMAILLQGSGPHSISPAAAGAAKQVVISRKAGEAVLRGAQLFVPGVLAVTSGLQAGDLVAVMVALDKPGSPHSGITRGTVLLAAAAAAAAANGSNFSHPSAAAGIAAAAAPLAEAQHATAAAAAAGTDDPADSTAAAGVPVAAAGSLICIGLGRAKMGRVEMFRVQHGVAVEMEQRVYEVPSPTLDGPLKGLVMLQNLPSILAAQVLNPQPGSRVLDMCAAPGGKTTMLAQLMRGKGQVIALDRLYGLGPAKCPGFAPESFDAVLLDAPCTALGLRPRLLQQQQLSLLLETAAYQRALLAAAVQLVKPGGVMVYSTCTISPAENEVNVRHALDSYPCLQLADTIGFFVAEFVKTCSLL
ncbi:hypothetical protein OEZ85_012263 [Tetradesmus obliquus]|uniref:SAM-dependent MTase RsmB/NOP-type domain-containing protein n=1 Tax=Tetradesmus obliquus TaxID=3088 RepID=A0ABY8TT59_TETOB|nr:hypothetical protein OEZ85_012263 [Tetradesmus obliquus]